MTGGAALFFIGGEEGEEPAFSSVDSVVVDSVGSVEVVKNKIASNLSLGLGKVVGNTIDSDGSCKRCLIFSLNGDGADELKVLSRHGRANNDNSSTDGLLWESFNFFLSISGGDVQVGSRLLLDAEGVMKDCVNADDDILFVIAGKMRSLNEVVDMMEVSVNIFYFQC